MRLQHMVSRLAVMISRKIPPHMKDKLLSIPFVARIRDHFYEGAHLQPFKIPGLPFDLTLFLNPAYPGGVPLCYTPTRASCGSVSLEGSETWLDSF
ncbi:MAG: hypothetical protein KatS3mg078_1681 [Deltaproteobacteria bacterium]|nr:MAG: hypothetical protein KatS3mg078_1681 [Deltaproteobacteria bacterium]